MTSESLYSSTRVKFWVSVYTYIHVTDDIKVFVGKGYKSEIILLTSCCSWLSSPTVIGVITLVGIWFPVI